jgi:hypothetical protein
LAIKSVELIPLDGKYYDTAIKVEFTDCNPVYISLGGGSGSGPSPREIENGWEPDHGMDHTETMATFVLADLIFETLDDVRIRGEQTPSF